MRKRGITLLEVLTVLGIVALLAAIAYPVFGSARAKSRETSCMERLRQIHAAIEMYGIDNPGFEPIHPNASYSNFVMKRPGLLSPYLGGEEFLFCPEAPPCARKRLLSTYTWTSVPDPSSSLYSSARRQLDEWFGNSSSGYPLVHCLVHDEMRYFPSERHLSEQINPPFVIRLLPGGSVVKGRYQIFRGHDIARSCR